MLEIKNLSIHYVGKEFVAKAVENVSLKLNQGELLGIVGESGCGKTTLARSIMGVNPDSAKIASGQIYFNNNKICLLYTSPSPRDRIASRMPSSA